MRLTEQWGPTIKQAVSNSLMVLERKSDTEILFDPFDSFIQVGMGGEWWSGKIKMGTTELHHRKEKVDEAYKPVKVTVRKGGADHLVIDVLGGFGQAATCHLKLIPVNGARY